MKFKKKPVIIDAWNIMSTDEAKPDWVVNAVARGVISFLDNQFEIQTLEGMIRVPMTHWIIKGVKDEIYACEPEIFDMTYERVE